MSKRRKPFISERVRALSDAERRRFRTDAIGLLRKAGALRVTVDTVEMVRWEAADPDALYDAEMRLLENWSKAARIDCTGSLPSGALSNRPLPEEPEK